MMRISPQELRAKIKNKEDFQLIDLREAYEFEDFNLGGINIPMDKIFSSLEKIEKNKPVVFCCLIGKKSAAVVHTIKKKLALDDPMYSLAGGIESYLEEI